METQVKAISEKNAVPSTRPVVSVHHGPGGVRDEQELGGGDLRQSSDAEGQRHLILREEQPGLLVARADLERDPLDAGPPRERHPDLLHEPLGHDAVQSHPEPGSGDGQPVGRAQIGIIEAVAQEDVSPWGHGSI
jgi:hypothetical protein